MGMRSIAALLAKSCPLQSPPTRVPLTRERSFVKTHTPSKVTTLPRRGAFLCSLLQDPKESPVHLKMLNDSLHPPEVKWPMNQPIHFSC